MASASGIGKCTRSPVGQGRTFSSSAPKRQGLCNLAVAQGPGQSRNRQAEAWFASEQRGDIVCASAHHVLIAEYCVNHIFEGTEVFLPIPALTQGLQFFC